jgi:molecular chaperone IbpA
MTNLLATWAPYSVGFEDTIKRFSELANTTLKAANYPPYDIVKVDDNKYVIEMAVAGFGKQNIEIELADGKLVVSGKLDSDEKSLANVLYKGIANRPFHRSFNLADSVEVEGAELVNGILKIWLENIIPDHKKPRKVEIADKVEEKSKQEVLKG